MSIYKEIIEKQEENRGSICLFKIGVFYVAIGKDAVFLSETLSLKRICYKKEVCKVGIPEKGFYKYLKEMAKLGLSVVVYQYNKNDIPKFSLIEELIGGEILGDKTCLDCKTCNYRKDIMSEEKVKEIMRNLNKEKLK